MQKKIIALAVAGLMSGAAFAQSNVTMYGVADAGYIYNGSHVTNGIGSKNSMGSGDLATSRLGFRGTEDLGNGLSVGFTYEMAVAVDEGDITTTNVRQSTLHIASKDYGTLQMGRQLTPQHTALAPIDPFGIVGTGSMSTIYGITSRLDNTFAYVSPTFLGGLTVVGGYTWNGLAAEGNENQSTTGDGRVWAISPRYSNGPIYIAANYHNVDLNTSVAATDGRSADVWDLGGTYDFGMVKVGFVYGQVDPDNKLSTATGLGDVDRWMLSASAPIGAKGTLMFSYVETDIDVVGGKDQDADMWAIGYTHSMSKRTRLYAKYHDVSYSNGIENAMATYGIGNVVLGGDSSSTFLPSYTSQFSVGLSHAF